LKKSRKRKNKLLLKKEFTEKEFISLKEKVKIENAKRIQAEQNLQELDTQLSRMKDQLQQEKN